MSFASPFGAMPGDAFARFVVLDGLVHGWDLATATGQTYEPSEMLVAEVDAFARQTIAPPMRGGDTFAAAVEPPAGATPIEQLAALPGEASDGSRFTPLGSRASSIHAENARVTGIAVPPLCGPNRGSPRFFIIEAAR